jgi:hypothetical protein
VSLIAELEPTKRFPFGVDYAINAWLLNEAASVILTTFCRRQAGFE